MTSYETQRDFVEATRRVEHFKKNLENAQSRIQEILKAAFERGELLTLDGLPYRVWYSRGKYRLKSALSRSAREELDARAKKKQTLRR